MTEKNLKQGLEALKEKFGKKLDIHVFNSSDDSKIKKYYSPTLFPKLKIKRNNTEYDIDVNFYSVEEENKTLLHHLLMKTREKTNSEESL